MKFITKRNVFIIGTSSIAFAIGLAKLLDTSWCGDNLICNQFYHNKFWYELIPQSLIALTILTIPFSLITFPLKPAVFERWKQFAVRAVPITLGLTLLLIFADEGSAYFSYGFSGLILILLYAWFTLHSLILIVYTAIKEHKNSV